MALPYVIAAVSTTLAIYFGIRYFVATSRKFGGGRVVICPETKKQATVEVDVRRAALTSLIGQADIRLDHCWRWPLKENCDQACLLQLDVENDECLVRGVLSKWYRGKKCAFCDRSFGELDLIDHKPALFTPEGTIIEWSAVPMSAVAGALATYQPVCWNCSIAQTFFHEHPDLVVERPVM